MREIPLTIVGNLTDDPELRFTPAGVAVAKFTIAQTPRLFDKAANVWRDGEATFLTCQAWRELAEHIAESLRKGHRVIAAGELRTQRWDDKEDPSKKLSRMVLDVSAIGPELTWATAAVKKMQRANGPTDDPWATASKQRPAGTDSAGPLDEEPPF